MKPILSTTDVAELLGCSTKTVEDRARSGELPGEKFGDGGWVFPLQALVDRVNHLAVVGSEARRSKRSAPPRGEPLVVVSVKPSVSRGRSPLPDLTHYVSAKAA